MTLFTQPALTTDEIVEVSLANALDEPSLAKIFVEARSANAFLDRAIPHQLCPRRAKVDPVPPRLGEPT